MASTEVTVNLLGVKTVRSMLEEAARQLAAMQEIVRAVAGEEYIRENASEIQCPFCTGELDYLNEPDYIRHTDGCVVVKAQTLLNATAAFPDEV